MFTFTFTPPLFITILQYIAHFQVCNPEKNPYFYFYIYSPTFDYNIITRCTFPILLSRKNLYFYIYFPTFHYNILTHRTFLTITILPPNQKEEKKKKATIDIFILNFQKMQDLSSRGKKYSSQGNNMQLLSGSFYNLRKCSAYMRHSLSFQSKFLFARVLLFKREMFCFLKWLNHR